MGNILRSIFFIFILILTTQLGLANEIAFSGSVVEDSCTLRSSNDSLCSTKISARVEYTALQSPNHRIITLTYF